MNVDIKDFVITSITSVRAYESFSREEIFKWLHIPNKFLINRDSRLQLSPSKDVVFNIPNKGTYEISFEALEALSFGSNRVYIKKVSD